MYVTFVSYITSELNKTTYMRVFFWTFKNQKISRSIEEMAVRDANRNYFHCRFI